MSTVVARRVASTPVRTAALTWEKIVSLVAPDSNSPARAELMKAAGVACSSISSEATRNAAIVVWGGSPRVRIYCLFDEAAMTGDGLNEEALPKSPTERDWRMSIPCLPEDVTWSQRALKAATSRVVARSMDEDVDDEEKPNAEAKAFTVNVGEFLKP